MTLPSLSQECVDTTSSRSIWTCSSTSRITSTRTSPTNCMWTTSSVSPPPPSPPSTRSTITVSSLTQPNTTQRPTIQPLGPTPSFEQLGDDDEAYHQIMQDRIIS